MNSNHLTSFTRDFLGVVGAPATPHRCLQALRAARRRWPEGRIRMLSDGCILYMVEDLTGLLIEPTRVGVGYEREPLTVWSS